MRIAASLCLLALFAIAFGQKTEPAIGKYAENGKLISVANLSPLKECPIRNVVGKLTNVKVVDNRVSIRLQNKKEDPVDIEVPLERLLADDRKAVLSDLLRKKMPLRIAGYACVGAAVEAFSVDRVY